MSDPRQSQPRPAGLPAALVILGSFALFLVLAFLLYARDLPAAPQDATPDRLPADMRWESTPEGRRAYLSDLRGRQAAQAASYGWVDRKAGIVQLPVDRAMELTVQAINAKH